MEMVAEQFGTSVTNDGFTVPPSVGSGFFKQYYPLSWLTLTYISFVSYEPMTMVRRSVENSKWIPVMFYINEHKHEQIIGSTAAEPEPSTPAEEQSIYRTAILYTYR